MLDVQKIHIAEIRVVRAQLDSPIDLDDQVVARFDNSVTLEFEFAQEDKLVRTILSVTVASITAQDEALADAEFELSFLFVVDNLDELIEQNSATNHITYNRDLGNALASITYSTARGVLLTRLQGTALQGFYLPVVNPDGLLESN
jgi:hypothetical protein